MTFDLQPPGENGLVAGDPLSPDRHRPIFSYLTDSNFVSVTCNEKSTRCNVLVSSGRQKLARWGFRM